MSNGAIPPPPVTGPYGDLSKPYLPPDNGGYQIWSYLPARGKWVITGQGFMAWNGLPLGYYRTPINYSGFAQLLVVTTRTDPSGALAPNVLNPQDAPTAIDSNSWPGMGTVDVSELGPPPDQGVPNAQWILGPPSSTMCALVASTQAGKCPPGQYYDPIAEMCKTEPVILACPPGTIFDPSTGTCQLVTVITVQPPPSCPPGTVWNPNTETCDPIITPDQPCIPNPSPYDDELKNGLDCISQNLIVMQQLLQQQRQGGGGSGGGNLDPVTCAQVTLAANAIIGALGQIVSAITAAGANSTPVTVNAPVTVNVPEQPPATVTVNAPPPDLTALVNALGDLFATIDVPPDVINALISSGYLSSEAAATIGQGAFGSSLVTTIVNFAYKAATNYLATFGITVDAAGTHFAGVETTIANDLGGLFKLLVTGSEATLTPIVQGLVKQVQGLLGAGGGFPLGAGPGNADAAVTVALGGALSAGIASWVMSYLGVDAGEPLAHVAELMGAAIGFEELRDVQIGPLLRNGIALQAERNAKAAFRQELPGTSALLGWVAQGLMTSARAGQLAPLNGTSAELLPIEAAAAYRGFNARQMLRLIETNLFSQAEIADELTFSAMRPASQARMLRAAPYLATAGQRTSLVAAIEGAAVAGLLADSEVTAQVDAAEQTEDRDSLILSRVHLQQLVAATKDLETEYTSLFKGGLMSDQLYHANLTALGLQPWKVSSLTAKAEAAANVSVFKKTLAAEAALEKATEAKERQAAMRNFTTGNIDAVALAAALIATGLTATQAAAWSDLAVLQKGGGLKWIYGLQLPTQQAEILRGRVGALTDQRKRQEITDLQYTQALQSLGLGPRFVNWLTAAADALISPKTAAFAVPVETT